MDKQGTWMRRALTLVTHADTELVCLDLTQTLTLRPFFGDDDLYQLMEDDARTLLGVTDVVDFAELRHTAEERVRSSGQTASLSRVYEALSELCGADMTPLLAKERARRMQHMQVRQAGQQLWTAARRAGKAVVVAADTVLSSADVLACLAALGYDCEGVQAFTSADAGACLADGGLLRVIGKPVKGKGVYIGSAANAKSAGWEGLSMPDPLATFKASQVYRETFLRMGSSVAAHEAEHYLGMRCMLAVAANHLFDDPDRKAGKGFDGDADAAGYAALGMYFLGNAGWLLSETAQSGYDTVGFLARDGYFVQRAFERMNEHFRLPVKTCYVRASRKSVFPLHFRRREDFLALGSLIAWRHHSPESLMGLFAQVIPPEHAEGLDALYQAHGMAYKRVFRSFGEMCAAMEVFADHVYDPAVFAAYREQAQAYVGPLFSGKCATYDVGYSARAEAVLRDLTGADMTAYFTHTDFDVAKRRGDGVSLPIRTLYDYTPYVSWMVREQFMAEDGPSCVGYGPGGTIIEAEEKQAPAYSAVIRTMQQAAMAFVDDMVDIFGDDLPRLHFRPVNACALFEHYLHDGAPRDMALMQEGNVDNSFVMATEKMSCYSFWRLLQSDFHAARFGDSYLVQKTRRLFMLLFHDRALLRQRIRNRIKR